MPHVVRRPEDKREQPVYLPTVSDDTVLAGTEVAQRYVFTRCTKDVQSVAEKVFNNSLKARRNVFKFRNAKGKSAAEEQPGIDKDMRELAHRGMATDEVSAD